MGVNVNTDEVRRVAKQIKGIAGTVSDLNTVDVRKMKSNLQGKAAGEMAVALNEVLDELSSDISKIAQSLVAIQTRLEKYAAEVEAADKRASEAIKG